MPVAIAPLHPCCLSAMAVVIISPTPALEGAMSYSQYWGVSCPMSLAPKLRLRSRAKEPGPPGIPNCGITLADFAIQQRPRDAQQTLNTEISRRRSWWGRCQRCCPSRAKVGFGRQPPSVPARDAASTTMLSSTWERTSHPRLVGQKSLPILSTEDLPSSDSQQAWQALSSSLPPSSQWFQTQSTCSSLPSD